MSSVFFTLRFEIEEISKSNDLIGREWVFLGGGDSKEFVSGYVRLECEKTGVLFMWRHFFFTVRVLVVKVPYGFCQI